VYVQSRNRSVGSGVVFVCQHPPKAAQFEGRRIVLGALFLLFHCRLFLASTYRIVILNVKRTRPARDIYFEFWTMMMEANVIQRAAVLRIFCLQSFHEIVSVMD